MGVAGGRAPVHIMANVPRLEALKVISQEGMLLVLCSLVDNMPYVLAEAAVSAHVHILRHCFPFHIRHKGHRFIRMRSRRSSFILTCSVAGKYWGC